MKYLLLLLLVSCATVKKEDNNCRIREAGNVIANGTYWFLAECERASTEENISCIKGQYEEGSPYGYICFWRQ